jgi:N-acetylglucosamine kinase-like BadF-type ATPase
MLFAGIDGGQSGTTAAIGDGTRVLARGASGPADEIGVTADSTRLRDALEDALAAAIAAADLPPDSRFDAIVAGVSGYEGHVYGLPPRLPAQRWVLMHDAPIAHAGALGGAPGVVVIAGTGSVAYTVAADGRTKTTGGWGYLFGDEGSAFWTVRKSIERAIAEGEARAAPLLEYFNVVGVRELVRAFYSGEISRRRLASFASVALRDEEVAGMSALALATLASHAVLERPCSLAFVGGMLRDTSFLRRVHERTRALLPDCELVEPVADPAEGALILAQRL